MAGEAADGGRGLRVLIVVLFAAAGGLYLAGRSRVPPPRPAAAAADGWWEGAGGFEKAEDLRRRDGRAIALYFHTDWCGWCKKLEADYFRSAEARPWLDSVIKVRVNPEEGSADARLASRFGVRGYPTLLILPARGGEPVRVHPFRSGGSMSVADFVAACRAAG